MPDELIDSLDAFAEAHGYTGRSEVVREASRNLLAEFDDRDLADRDLLGIVTVLFDYDSPTSEERMIDLRHDYEGLVTSNVHNHVGDGYCMELFVLEGTLDEVSAFVGKVRAVRDTLSVDYSVVPLDEAIGETAM